MFWSYEFAYFVPWMHGYTLLFLPDDVMDVWYIWWHSGIHPLNEMSLLTSHCQRIAKLTVIDKKFSIVKFCSIKFFSFNKLHIKDSFYQNYNGC